MKRFAAILGTTALLTITGAAGAGPLRMTGETISVMEAPQHHGAAVMAAQSQTKRRHKAGSRVSRQRKAQSNPASSGRASGSTSSGMTSGAQTGNNSIATPASRRPSVTPGPITNNGQAAPGAGGATTGAGGATTGAGGATTGAGGATTGAGGATTGAGGATTGAGGANP